jgi:hypothetical protein
MAGDRGRFLQVEDGADLLSYRGGIVELRPSELSSNKNKPKILDKIRAASDHLLWEKLASSNLFESIYPDRRLDLPDGLPALRLEPHLTLDMGSRGKRFLSTGSTHVTAPFEQPRDDGRSKLWIRIDVLDARTGTQLATFRGFGIGFGQKTITGGNVAGLAEHDLEVNYAELIEMLTQEMADPPTAEGGP